MDTAIRKKASPKSHHTGPTFTCALLGTGGMAAFEIDGFLTAAGAGAGAAASAWAAGDGPAAAEAAGGPEAGGGGGVDAGAAFDVKACCNACAAFICHHLTLVQLMVTRARHWLGSWSKVEKITPDACQESQGR
jgi:hypothetical protein